MVDIKINTNHLEELNEVLEVANIVFQPNEAEKARYHRKEDWLLKIENGLMVTAVVGGKVIGFAICYRKENTLHIWNVGVLPEHRKNGAWRKMYDAIVLFARENGFESISLNTYKEKFPSMYNFCQTHGFEEYNTELDELSGTTKSMFLKRLQD